ncbi:hypothetical protein MJT46_003698 [Ovis ammon polii x Ovis aries]|nr:hypothetical protein MJT46_003698 [Ovis ammon polii x Ovis aries]
MKTLLLLAVIMAVGLLQVHGSLLDFRKMIKFATGKEPATNYSFYGCYCGMRGRGTPKDATDRTLSMKTLLLLAVIIAIGLLQGHGSLADFQKMVKFTTGKDLLTTYSFYGCHCGAGNRGTPKDATDRSQTKKPQVLGFGYLGISKEGGIAGSGRPTHKGSEEAAEVSFSALLPPTPETLSLGDISPVPELTMGRQHGATVSELPVIRASL